MSETLKPVERDQDGRITSSPHGFVVRRIDSGEPPAPGEQIGPDVLALMLVESRSEPRRPEVDWTHRADPNAPATLFPNRDVAHFWAGYAAMALWNERGEVAHMVVQPAVLDPELTPADRAP